MPVALITAALVGDIRCAMNAPATSASLLFAPILVAYMTSRCTSFGNGPTTSRRANAKILVASVACFFATARALFKSSRRS